MKKPDFTIHVPATSANLGPGFDCLAVALDLWNHTCFHLTGNKYRLAIKGEGEGILPENDTNEIIKSLHYGMEYLQVDKPEGILVECQNHIPVSSGLGSSAAAVLTGLFAANVLAGNPLNQDQLLQLACRIEGHPDNVSAAILGELVLVAFDDERCYTQRYSLPNLNVVLVIPQLNIPTRTSRNFLPEQYSRSDTTYNLARVPLVIEALRAGDIHRLRETMQDRLHQPYRLPHFKGTKEAMQAAASLGAAVSLSGAGPGLIAFTSENPQKLASAMSAAFQSQGIECRSWILRPASKGIYED